MSSEATQGSVVHRALKRSLDLVGATVGLCLLSPVLAGAAIAIRSSIGSPVIFRQRRPGRNGEPFTIYKFRTMREPKPGEERFTSDGDRLTPLGRFLRRTSIDELPELFNVLKGDMSLVGPRPLLIEYLERYTPEQKRRHDVRPGITGLAQVSGRQHLRFSQRLELDVEYVDSWSVVLDVVILWRTVRAVAGGSGVESGQAIADVDDLGLYQGKGKSSDGLDGKEETLNESGEA